MRRWFCLVTLSATFLSCLGAAEPPPENPVLFSGTASDQLLPEEDGYLSEHLDVLDASRSMTGATRVRPSGAAPSRSGFPSANQRSLEALARRLEAARNWTRPQPAESGEDTRFEDAVDRWSKAGNSRAGEGNLLQDWFGDSPSRSRGVPPRLGSPERGSASTATFSLEQGNKSSASLDPVLDAPVVANPLDGALAGVGKLAQKRENYRGDAIESSRPIATTVAAGLPGSTSDLLRMPRSIRELIEGRSAGEQEGQDGNWLMLQQDSTREELNPVMPRRWESDPLGRRSRLDPWDRRAISSSADNSVSSYSSPLKELTARVLGPSSLSPALPSVPVLEVPKAPTKGSVIELPGRKF